MSDTDAPLQYLLMLMKFAFLITVITLLYASEVSLLLLPTGVYPYLPVVTNAPWSIVGGIN